MKIMVYNHFLRLNGIATIKNAKIKMLRFWAQIAKISNRRKYLLYGIQVLCHVVDLKHGFVTSWENVLFALGNIRTCVEITWNYFPCLVLHKVKVFIDFAQGMVQILSLIFYIDDFIVALFIFMKGGIAVNYNGSEIIGLTNLKYGKRTACQDNFLPWTTEYNASCQVKVQKDGFETISHDFWNIFDKWLSHRIKWRHQ